MKPTALVLLLLALTGCARHHALRCLLLDTQTCPDNTNGGASALAAPPPPNPPDPCASASALTNNQCNTNPLGLATTCDPTDADGDPYDDDCTPAPATAPGPDHP